MKRTANAQWNGDLKSGKGNISTASGVLTQTPYSFGTRFEEGKGTNPEELLAAAHAGCFTMALSLMLTKAGHPPTSVETTATVNLDKVGEGFSIVGIDLVTKGQVPGADDAVFKRLANEAKEGCIVSRALKVPMTLEATLTA